MEWTDTPDDWVDRREQVLERDDYECQQCGARDGLYVRRVDPDGGYDPDNLETVCRDCHLDEGDRRELVRDDLLAAMHRRRRSRIEYDVWDDPHEFDAYGITDHDGESYVVGYDHDREGVRTLRPDHVESVTQGSETFERPDDWVTLAEFDDEATYEQSGAGDTAGGTDASKRREGSADASVTAAAASESSGGSGSSGSSGSSSSTTGGSSSSSSGGWLNGLGGGGGGGGGADCFVATAAYGTPLAAEIDVLRDFRDQSMRSNPVGRFFVWLYYTLSPPIARWIADSERRRRAVRVLLRPLIALTGWWLNRRHTDA